MSREQLAYIIANANSIMADWPEVDRTARRCWVTKREDYIECPYCHGLINRATAT